MRTPLSIKREGSTGGHRKALQRRSAGWTSPGARYKAPSARVTMHTRSSCTTTNKGDATQKSLPFIVEG